MFPIFLLYTGRRYDDMGPPHSTHASENGARNMLKQIMQKGQPWFDYYYLTRLNGFGTLDEKQVSIDYGERGVE